MTSSGRPDGCIGCEEGNAQEVAPEWVEWAQGCFSGAVCRLGGVEWAAQVDGNIVNGDADCLLSVETA